MVLTFFNGLTSFTRLSFRVAKFWLGFVYLMVIIKRTEFAYILPEIVKNVNRLRL